MTALEFNSFERNPTAVAIERVLAEWNIDAEVTAPTDGQLNHVNVTTPAELAEKLKSKIVAIAAGRGTNLNLETRDPNTVPVRDEAGGMTYAEMEEARCTSAFIATRQGGSEPGFYMPHGTRYFGSH